MRKATGSHSAGTGTEHCTATEPWSRTLVHLMDRWNTEHCEGEDLSCFFFLSFGFQNRNFHAYSIAQSNLNSCSKKIMFIVLVMTPSNSIRTYRTLDFCISQPTIYIT